MSPRCRRRLAALLVAGTFLGHLDRAAAAGAPEAAAASPPPAAETTTAPMPAAPPIPAVPAPPPTSPASPAAGGRLYSLLGAVALYSPIGAGEAWAVLPRTSGLSMTQAYVSGYGGRPGEAVVGPGAIGDLGAFRIDGFEVGDALSPGVPLDAGTETAQAIDVFTGGGDLAVLSSGLQIDLVERRGTNEWRASARGSGAGGALAAAAPRASALAPGQAASEDVSGDRVRSMSAAGAEAGGPLSRDTAWAWGAVDRSRTALAAFGGEPLSAAELAGAAKLDARLPAGNSLTLAWNRSARDVEGEGAGPDRAPETTLAREATSEVWRLSDVAILSPRLYAGATAGAVRTGSDEVPQGGLGVPLVIDPAGVAQGSWYADDDRRSTAAAGGEVNLSGRLAGGANELRLAGEWRHLLDQERWRAPDWSEITAGQVLGLPVGEDALNVWRDGDTRDEVTRQGAWLSDTVSWSRVTATGGLRFDRQTPANLASSVPGVPGYPVLGAVYFAGNDADGVRWSSLVPRLALAFSPAHLQPLVLRASLARYAQEMSSAIPARVDPAAPASAAYYLGPPYGQTFWYSDGFDPALPANVPANLLARNLRPEMTDEAILGGEYALPRDGSIGLTLQYRRVTGILEDRLLVRDESSGLVRTATAADWVPAGVATGALPNGAAYSVPWYDLRSGLTPTGGTLLVNGDRRQQLLGAALAWRQRLSPRWSARAHFAYESWSWKLGPSYLQYADPTPSLIDGAYGGQPVAGQPLPGGRPIYLLSPWSCDLAATVELPADLTAAAVITGRQGLPLAYFITVPREAAGPVDLRLADVDASRTGDLATLGARLAKDWNAAGDLGVTLSLEALNLLGGGQVLRRETNLGVGRANYVDEVEAPRLLRLGLRLAFR
jgi:hypothetical protein